MRRPNRWSTWSVSRRARLLVAALLWTLVGAGLGAAGAVFAFRGATSPGGRAAVLGAALGIGLGKGRFLLAPRARANAERIRASASRAPLTTVYTASSWLLIPLMIAVGYAVRRSGIPAAALGGIYLAVGFGLLVGAAPAWRAWRALESGRG